MPPSPGILRCTLDQPNSDQSERQAEESSAVAGSSFIALQGSSVDATDHNAGVRHSEAPMTSEETAALEELENQHRDRRRALTNGEKRADPGRLEDISSDVKGNIVEAHCVKHGLPENLACDIPSAWQRVLESANFNLSDYEKPAPVPMGDDNMNQEKKKELIGLQVYRMHELLCHALCKEQFCFSDFDQNDKAQWSIQIVPPEEVNANARAVNPKAPVGQEHEAQARREADLTEKCMRKKFNIPSQPQASSDRPWTPPPVNDPPPTTPLDMPPLRPLVSATSVRTENLTPSSRETRFSNGSYVFRQKTKFDFPAFSARAATNPIRQSRAPPTSISEEPHRGFAGNRENGGTRRAADAVYPEPRRTTLREDRLARWLSEESAVLGSALQDDMQVTAEREPDNRVSVAATTGQGNRTLSARAPRGTNGFANHTSLPDSIPRSDRIDGPATIREANHAPYASPHGETAELDDHAFHLYRDGLLAALNEANRIGFADTHRGTNGLTNNRIPPPDPVNWLANPGEANNVPLASTSRRPNGLANNRVPHPNLVDRLANLGESNNIPSASTSRRPPDPANRLQYQHHDNPTASSAPPNGLLNSTPPPEYTDREDPPAYSELPTPAQDPPTATLPGLGLIGDVNTFGTGSGRSPWNGFSNGAWNNNPANDNGAANHAGNGRWNSTWRNTQHNTTNNVTNGSGNGSGNSPTDELRHNSVEDLRDNTGNGNRSGSGSGCIGDGRARMHTGQRWRR